MPKRKTRQSQGQHLLGYGSVTASLVPRVEKRLKQSEVTMSRDLVLVSLSGDDLTKITVEDDNEKITWSSILERIATEEWFQVCKKWRFIVGDKILQPGDVLESDSDTITITCIKIVPRIIFMQPDGEILVSIPFETCRSMFNGEVFVRGAALEAHKKLKEIGEDGYGTHRTKVHPLLVTYMCNGCEVPCCAEHPHDFRHENGEPLDLDDVLEDPGDGNVTVVVVPKRVYCHDCVTKICGPLRIGDRRRSFCERIDICSSCGFLHCPSCGFYGNRLVRSSECH